MALLRQWQWLALTVAVVGMVDVAEAIDDALALAMAKAFQHGCPQNVINARLVALALTL